VATVLLRVPKELVVRVSLGCFAVSLAVLAVLRSPGPAYPTLFAVGLFYFTMPTSLNTFLQAHLAEGVRGRVMALWVVSFGGIISITNLFSGWAAKKTSVTAVLLVGAVAAAIMALAVRLEPGSVVGDELTTSRRP
jgi:sugar phosphate permease